MRWPSESVANASMPRSIPVSCPGVGSGWIGTSAHEKQAYQPSTSQLIVTVLGVPSNGRCNRMGIRPIFDKLRIGNTIVTIASVKARIARRLTALDATEERLKGAIYPLYHILQDLRIDLGIFWHGFLDAGQFGLLLIVRDTDAALTPSFPTLFHGGVVDVTAEHHSTIKHPLLFRSGLEFVLVCLAYALPFHTLLFCLIGANPATVRTFAVLASPPAFITITEKQGDLNQLLS